MKNIINWTFGGFFRSLGRILCYLVIGALIGLLLLNNDIKIPSWLKIMRVNADSFDYTLGQYRLQYHMGNNNTWVGPYDFNTSTDTTSYDYIKAFAVRLGNSNKFVGMREYTISIEVGYSPISAAINNAYTAPTSFSCAGSTSLTSWSADSSKVDSCEFVGATRVGNTNHIKYIYKIKMKQDILGIQININLYDNPPYGINGFNVYKNSTITYGEDVSGAIDNQTIIIQNEINNLEDVINENNNNLINVINENNNSCSVKTAYNLTTNYTKNISLAGSGTTYCSSCYTTDYISLENFTSIMPLFSENVNYQLAFYTIDKTFISFVYLSNNLRTEIPIPSNAFYFRFTFASSSTKLNICGKKVDNTSDILTDTDTSGDTNSIYDAMYNFNLSIEGPLSTIIRLPIDLLDTLLIDYNDNERHADLCTTFRGQQICLPSGDIVWKRSGCHDNSPFGCPDYNAFKTFFQLVAGGGITYFLLKRLIKTIEKGLDPTKSEVNLMRL